MPIRNESNRAYLIASLDIYRDAMRDFIIRELKKNQSRRVEDTLRKYLRANPRRYDVRDPRSMFDVNDFFFIIGDNWQEVFREAFNGDKFVLDTLRQITSIRNNAAHPAYGADIDRAWALARIYDMSDILGRIGAASEKVRVQAIWNQLDIQNVQSTPLPTQPEQMERYSNNAKVSANIPTPQAPVRATDELSYVVYVDNPTNRSRVHRSDCRYYINRREEILSNNQWHHGPYSREEAFAKMDRLGKRDSGPCGTCNP